MYNFDKIEFYQDAVCEDLSTKEKIAKNNLKKELSFSESPLKLVSFDTESLKASAIGMVAGLFLSLYLRKGYLLFSLIGAASGNVINNVNKKIKQ